MISTKKHRRNYITNTKTVSFTLDNRLIESLEEKAKKETGSNVSKYIEENISPLLPFSGDIPRNRPYKTYPKKKTFTFTEDFVINLKAHGNMSLLVETIFVKKLRLNLK